MRALPLRQAHPQLSELRVLFEFEDGSTRAPSPQAYSYYPAAKAFFRYTCPCHGCNGEFDLSGPVDEIASRAGSGPADLQLSLPCPGQRARDVDSRVDCPIRASVRVSASIRPTGE